LFAPEKDPYLLKDIASRISVTAESSQRQGDAVSNSSCEQIPSRYTLH